MPDTPNRYELMARLYGDILGGDAFALEMAELYSGLLGEPPGRGLELACGGGVVAAYLAGEGWDVTAVDHSEGMLQHARRRAPNVRWLCQDIRQLDAGGLFDWVLCSHDGLANLHQPAELEQTLQRVFTHLQPGGRFLFDLQTWDGARTLHNDILVRDTADWHVTCRVDVNDAERLVTLLTTAFERQPEGHWIRHDEAITERVHETDCLEAALRKAGFVRIERRPARLRMVWRALRSGPGN